ncbi:MAG: hypothetical protein R8G66_27290 [Cytophagales bacterium]|nr:hypothetical protein [Cytophagales bacterium]
MVLFRNLALLALTFWVYACTESTDQVMGNENPVQSILISEIDVNDDFTSTSFKLSNKAKSTYYTGVVVIAEFRREGRKIGSELMVVYPPLFGPGKHFVHEQSLYPASETDELHLYVERASFYPEHELKSILENEDK